AEEAPQETVEVAPPIPPEVLFSVPTDGETDVALDTTVRIQFSRDIDPETLPGRVRVSYSAQESAERGEPQPPAIGARLNYREPNRVLEIRFDSPLQRFRTVTVELLEGIRGTDGAPLKPWTLTFTLGG
ncbi:MAG TPA: Ig-like domain-containing protein, partial [Vicinamibacterales bacterium]